VSSLTAHVRGALPLGHNRVLRVGCRLSAGTVDGQALEQRAGKEQSAPDRRARPPVLLSKPEKYCHNGGMGFAHHHGAGLAWDRKVDDGPFAWSPETAVLQGKS
jgi:hypothetical protein